MKKMVVLQVLRNTMPWKKVRAKSYEEGVGIARKQFEWDKSDYYYEIKYDGRVIPLYI